MTGENSVTILVTRMHVISKRMLIVFVAKHPDAERPLAAWLTLMKRGRYDGPAALRHDFASASFLSGNCVVFNIAGNSYRLVAYVLFRTKRVYIRHTVTHAAYTRLSGLSRLC